MISKADIQTTLNFWIQSRINGVSASMCVDAEYVNADILAAFERVRLELEAKSNKSEMVELPEWTEALMPEYQESGDQDES